MSTPTHTLLRPQGYALITEPGKADRECDTVTCSHCNSVVFLWPDEPGKQPADLLRTCGMCDQRQNQVCLACAAEQRRTLKCIPFERQLEHMERGGRFMEAVLGRDAAIRNRDQMAWVEDRRRAQAERAEREGR